MGLRFRRTIRIVPGLRMNFSKSSASLSVGGRGAAVNLGSKGVRTTVGIPGTGISSSSYTSHAQRTARTQAAPAGRNSAVYKDANLALACLLLAAAGIWVGIALSSVWFVCGGIVLALGAIGTKTGQFVIRAARDLVFGVVALVIVGAIAWVIAKAIVTGSTGH